MKFALALLAALAMPALAASPSTDPSAFEVELGCVSNKEKATCVLQNKHQFNITCDVSITGTTAKGMKIGNKRTIVVPYRMFDDSIRVFVAEGDVLVKVDANAVCKRSE